MGGDGVGPLCHVHPLGVPSGEKVQESWRCNPHLSLPARLPPQDIYGPRELATYSCCWGRENGLGELSSASPLPAPWQVAWLPSLLSTGPLGC